MHHANRPGSDRGDSGGAGITKRTFGALVGDGSQVAAPEEKRQKLPALASVVVEAVKMDSLQKLCSSLEPILRRVVGEEVERALARLVPNRLGARTPPRQIQEPHVSDLRLIFKNKLALPLFTGGKVEGEQGLPIHILLEDASTGQIVTSGLESTAKLEVVVLDGDFANDDEEWTAEDFENHVVKERDGKRPLLTGDLFITLKEGVGTLGELTFTDNSSWIRSRKFRLGVRVAAGFCEGIRIQECKTDAFTVKDHRGELYKKHYPPVLNDEVWRLDKIGKDGAFHKRLQQNDIRTVEEFLRCFVMDQQKLRNTLGSGMSNKMWEATVEHAKTCVLSGKLYVFYADSQHNIGVIFNNIYELMGVTSNGSYKSAESLTENEKVYVDKLVKVAYDNWSSVTEYDSGALDSENTYKHAVMYSENEGTSTVGISSGLKEQPLMYSQSVGLSQQPRQFQGTSTVTNTPGGGVTSQFYNYDAETSTRYASQEHQLIPGNQVFSEGNNPPNNQLSSNMPLQSSFSAGNEASVTGLALGPSQSMVSRSFGLQSGPSQQAFQAGSVEWQRTRTHDPMTPAADHFFTEEDIRAKTLELLGNEDMQQLLRLQYTSLPENFQLQGDDTYFSGFTPSPAVSYGEDGVRPSGKAYVGWLKLKAALRWGIFIRKIAAQKAVKRAQLEELED